MITHQKKRANVWVGSIGAGDHAVGHYKRLVNSVVLSGTIAKLKLNIPMLIDNLIKQSTFNSNLLRKLSSLTYILTSSSFYSSCTAEKRLFVSQTGKKKLLKIGRFDN